MAAAPWVRGVFSQWTFYNCSLPLCVVQLTTCWGHPHCCQNTQKEEWPNSTRTSPKTRPALLENSNSCDPGSPYGPAVGSLRSAFSWHESTMCGVTLHKLLNLLNPFPHLPNGGNDSIQPVASLWGWNEMMHIKYSAQQLAETNHMY